MAWPAAAVCLAVQTWRGSGIADAGIWEESRDTFRKLPR